MFPIILVKSQISHFSVSCTPIQPCLSGPYFNIFNRLSLQQKKKRWKKKEKSGQEKFSVFLMRENNIFIEKLSAQLVVWLMMKRVREKEEN